MDAVTEQDIRRIEKELSARLVEQFSLSLRTLTYDGTKLLHLHQEHQPRQGAQTRPQQAETH